MKVRNDAWRTRQLRTMAGSDDRRAVAIGREYALTYGAANRPLTRDGRSAWRQPPIHSLLDFRLLGDLQSVIDFNAQVAHCAFELRVTEQQLNRPQVLGLAVDQCGLSSAHRVRTVGSGVETDGADPSVHDAGVLPGRYMGRVMSPTREEVLLRLEIGLGNPCGDGIPGLFRQFKLYRPLSFALHDHCPWLNLTAMDDIANPEIDQIAAAQLAIDGEIEERQISNAMVVLKVNTNGPDVF